MCGRRRKIQEKSQFSVRKAVSRHFERCAGKQEPARISAAPSAKIVTIGGTRFRISQHPYHPLGLKPGNGVGAGFTPARIREDINPPRRTSPSPTFGNGEKMTPESPKNAIPPAPCSPEGIAVLIFLFLLTSFCLLSPVFCLLLFSFFHYSNIPLFPLPSPSPTRAA